MYGQRSVTSSACNMGYTATLFQGACRWMLLLGAARTALNHFVEAELCEQSCVTSSACRTVYTVTLPRCLQVDVHSKPCQEPGCTKRPHFGFPGGKAQFCLAHKSAEMVCHRFPCLLICFVQAALSYQQCLQGGAHCDSVSAVPAGGYLFQALPRARVHKATPVRLLRRKGSMLFGAQVR